jgi:hypothetical protein
MRFKLVSLGKLGGKQLEGVALKDRAAEGMIKGI